MFFDRFAARFWPHFGKENHKKGFQTMRAAVHPKKSPSLQLSKNLNSTKELNTALKEIEQAIQNKTATNQQLLLKAEILLRKEKFRQAKAVLTDLSSNRKEQNVRNRSNHLLDKLPHLQQKASNRKSRMLISDLTKIAEKYQTKLLSLPEPDGLTPNCDITLLIRKESRLARSSELPCLSYELIERTLKSGLESPWLLHDKALSLNMMGQHEKALKLLKDLKTKTEKEKLSKAINKNIKFIQNNSKDTKCRANSYFAKHADIAAKRNNLEVSFTSNPIKANHKGSIKSLIFRKARAVLAENPKASLDLIDSILDYFQGDLAALLLKGEALDALKKPGEAMEIWIKLARSDDKNIAQKASELVSQHFFRKARAISKNKSADAALAFFIKQHLKLNLVPMLNKDVKKILQRLDGFDGTLNDPELEHHQLQLLFNTQLIDCLEAQLREQGRLGGTSPAQKPGAIGKTAPTAG